MAKQKEVIGQIKLQIAGAKATPAPPVGPALGSKGVNIAAFVKQFNDATAKMAGDIIPVIITVYKDKSFDFVLKQPPVAVLLKKAAGIESAASNPGLLAKAGTVTRAQVREIAQRKLAEMTAHTLEAAERSVLGAARSMGIVVSG
jgi:large subunit ribosomal protein L11